MKKRAAALMALTKKSTAGPCPAPTKSTLSSEMGEVQKLHFNLATPCIMIITHLGQYFPRGYRLALWGKFGNIYRHFGSYTWGRRVLLASSWERPWMLVNILQYTGQVITMKTYLHCWWPEMSIVLRPRSPHLGQEMKEEIFGNSINGTSFVL